MEHVKDEQIEKLLEDIESIKTVIKQNKSTLQQLLLPTPFRRFFAVLGTLVIVYSMLAYFFALQFGNYAAIPSTYKNTFYGLLIVSYLAMIYMKYSTWWRTIKKIDRKYTLRSALKETFTQRVSHTLLPITVLSILLVVYLIYIGAYRLIVPTLCIGTGLTYNFLGSLTEIKPYLVGGYWLLLTGTLVVAVASIPTPIALAVSFGLGQIFVAAISHKEE